MTVEIVFAIALGILVILFALTLPFAIKDIKRLKKEQEEYDKNIDEYFENDGEILETRAEVIDMSCGTDMVGGKTAKSVRWFKVKFEKYDGEIIDVPVDEEMYEGLEVGMRGNLRLVDGHLNSFELD